MLHFVDYEKALAQVNRLTLFNTLHKRNIPDPSLSALVEIKKHIEIKIRQDNEVTQIVVT
jgi:hypothetical protein